jgi:predicted transcriptional regulator
MHNYMSPLLKGMGNTDWEQGSMTHALRQKKPVFMSKAEFAEKAGVPLSLVGRLEKGKTYLVDAKGKKILDAGYDFPSKRVMSVADGEI